MVHRPWSMDRSYCSTNQRFNPFYRRRLVFDQWRIFNTDRADCTNFFNTNAGGLHDLVGFIIQHRISRIQPPVSSIQPRIKPSTVSSACAKPAAVGIRCVVEGYWVLVVFYRHRYWQWLYYWLYPQPLADASPIQVKHGWAPAL